MADDSATLKRVEREMLIRTRLLGRGGALIAPLLADLAEEMTFEPGAVVTRAGDPYSYIYAVIHGELELSADGSPPHLLQDDGIVGFLEALRQQPRRHTLTARTQVQLLRLIADDYLDLLEDHFEFLMTILLGAAADLHGASLALAPDGGFPQIDIPTSGLAALPEAALNLPQKLGVLRDAQAFSGANMQALVRLAGLAEEIRVEAGGTLFERGEAAGKFFLVAGGVVEASRVDPVLSARFGHGDLVCGYGALGQADDQYVAKALCPVIAFAFREEAFFDVMEEHFELSRSVLAAIAGDFERLAIEGKHRGVKVTPLPNQHVRRTSLNPVA